MQPKTQLAQEKSPLQGNYGSYQRLFQRPVKPCPDTNLFLKHALLVNHDAFLHLGIFIVGKYVASDQLMSIGIRSLGDDAIGFFG